VAEARGMTASALRERPLPQLDLSGPKLRQALAALLSGAEALGGIERYVAALRLKAELYQSVLGGAVWRAVEPTAFATLVAFMPTVRRRIGAIADGERWARLRAALAHLLADLDDVAHADERLAAARAQFADDRAHRWVRDLAAEILHNLDPERYPLMTRWVWDARANTGALREIWHGVDVDRLRLDAADDYATFVMLRQELAVFLSGEGFFRDLVYYVDLLLAQVYAEYLCAQGGVYLRTDFSTPDDPMEHTRRMLGLDGIRPARGGPGAALDVTPAALAEND